MQESLVDLQERIFQAINNKKTAQLEEAWLEAMTLEPQPVSFHQPIIDRLMKKQDPSRFTLMYEQWLDATIEKEDGLAALEVIDLIIAKYTQAEWLRPRLVDACRLAYSSSTSEMLETYMGVSGLEDEDTPMVPAYLLLKDLVAASKGHVFLHRTWGLGVVKEMDIDEGKVVIDFDLRKRQVMTLDGVRNFLQPIPEHHVRAKMALYPDDLKEEIKEKPADVIRRALKGTNTGKMKVSELKRLLTERFLTDAEYKSFWTAARKAIKLDPWIDQNGTGAHAELVHREKPRSFFDHIFQEILKSTTSLKWFELLRDVRRHGSDAEMTEEDDKALFAVFQKPLQDGTLTDDAARLRHGLLFVEFTDLFEGQLNPIDVNALLMQPNHLDLVRELEVHEIRKQGLAKLRELYPDNYGEKWAEVVLSLDTRTATWLERELKSADDDHNRQVAFEAIVAKPDANTDLFCWAAKNILDKKWKDLADTLPPIMIFEELLSLLGQIQDEIDKYDEDDKTADKNAAAKVRALINESNAKHFKTAVKGATVEEARRILKDIRLHNGLSHQMKAHLESILIDIHEELRTGGRAEEEEERRASHHYTTRDRLDEKRTELSRIMLEEIPEAAKRIKVASDLGDLKENSEYHAAKDSQKLLMQRAAELEELIARARVVEPREVTPDSTRFGTKVFLRNLETKEERDVTLLGMWEADPSINIISYLTPFGSQLLGRKVGDEFEVVTADGTKTEYKVLAIESAMTKLGN